MRIFYKEQAGAHQIKIAELRAACDDAIMSGVEVETSLGLEHFSLTYADQLNIDNRLKQIENGAGSVLYHADGQLCREFTAEEIKAVAVKAIAHGTYHTTYFNHLKAWVKMTEEPGKLEEIYYGATLPKELKKGMEALLEASGGEA